MRNLIRAEWLKLTRRPLTWVLLAIFLALLAFQFAQFWFVATIGAAILHPAQVEEMRRRLAFPGIFGAVLGHINGPGGIFAVILAAGALGSEYSWGTLRTQLTRTPNRGMYLLAKVVTLVLLLLAAMLISLVVGTLIGGALGAYTGAFGAIEATALLALPFALVRALLVLLPYVLVTLCFTVYGRSLLVGLAGGLLYQIADVAFGALATYAQLGGVWRTLYVLAVQANINTLTTMNSRAFGLRPEAIDTNFDPTLLPSPWQATLVILVYCVLSSATALYIFQRRDIGGAS